VSDFYGNKTIVSVPISLLTTQLLKEVVRSNYFVKVNKDNILLKQHVGFFPGTFYENFDMNFDVKGDTLSCMMILYLSIALLHHNIEMINTRRLKRKMYIADDVDKSGRRVYTTIKGNVFTARTRSLENIL
jgi:hypothetical protein